MDGLNRQPFNLGVFTANWLDAVVPRLGDQMSALQSGGIQFNMLAVVKDPIVESREQLAANVKLIQAIETRLDSITTDWKVFTSEIEDDEYITSASEGVGLTLSMIDQAHVSDADGKKLRVDDDINTLIEWRERTINDQAPLRANIRDELQIRLEDEAKAQDRRNDYGPVIQAWLNELAENEVLRDLADQVMEPVKKK
jgi:ubiquitin carboxyl-terminal hydrolase L5